MSGISLDIRISLPPDDELAHKVIYKDLELLCVQGTPHEQNCLILYRHHQPDYPEEAKTWHYELSGISADLAYVIKLWWNHYQSACDLQKFIDLTMA